MRTKVSLGSLLQHKVSVVAGITSFLGPLYY